MYFTISQAETAFQFLIGTLKTSYRLGRCFCWCAVSIPHRYAKNLLSCRMYHRKHIVSIPHRYAKNEEARAAAIAAEWVSIPHRYAKNPVGSIQMDGILRVSIPHRYAKNGDT